MAASNFSCFEPFCDLSVTMTCEIDLPYPPSGLFVYYARSSVTSPSYTYLFSLMRRPMARLKFSISTSVFFTSALYTSLPTIGQNGTLEPSTLLIPIASAVLPEPGGPAKSNALPAIFFVRISYTTMPAASRAAACPTNPSATRIGSPFSSRPNPFTWLWAATRSFFVVETTYSILIPDIILVNVIFVYVCVPENILL